MCTFTMRKDPVEPGIAISDNKIQRRNRTMTLTYLRVGINYANTNKRHLHVTIPPNDKTEKYTRCKTNDALLSKCSYLINAVLHESGN